MGRPTDYNKDIADLICEKIADGRSLRDICSDENLPNKATVFRWLSAHAEFSDQYARAREAQAEAYVEESFEIADDARNDWMEKFGRDGQSLGYFINGEAVARSRLRIEHRRWAAEKLKPKVYGNKQFVEHSGGITLGSIDSQELVSEMLELLATGRLKLPNGIELAEADDEDEDDFSDLAAAKRAPPDDDPYGVG